MTLFNYKFKGISRKELNLKAIEYLRSLTIEPEYEPFTFVFLVALPEFLLTRTQANLAVKLPSRAHQNVFLAPMLKEGRILVSSKVMFFQKMLDMKLHDLRTEGTFVKEEMHTSVLEEGMHLTELGLKSLSDQFPAI